MRAWALSLDSCRFLPDSTSDVKSTEAYQSGLANLESAACVLACSVLFRLLIVLTNGKKHPKKICIKNFGGTLAGGSRRGFRRPNSLCSCWFSQQNTVHKEFRGGGGLTGSWGWGLRSNFGAPFLYVYVLFWGLRYAHLFQRHTLRIFSG